MVKHTTLVFLSVLLLQLTERLKQKWVLTIHLQGNLIWKGFPLIPPIITNFVSLWNSIYTHIQC